MLLAGSDGGASHLAVIASLIDTCKRNGVDPQADLAADRQRHPVRRPTEELFRTDRHLARASVCPGLSEVPTSRVDGAASVNAVETEVQLK